MKIFVLNCGSTTFKYQLFDMTSHEVIAQGIVEKIGLPDVQLTHQVKDKKIKENLGAVAHKEGIARVLSLLTDSEQGVLKNLNEIEAVGHRVVQGTAKYPESVIITDEVLKDIDDFKSLAPLHNPAHVVGIKMILELVPNAKNVAVFDTAYHQTMPPEAYRYAIPVEYYETHKLRKYGAHGTSHQYVSQETAKLLNINYNEFNAISCHLGGGCSITAIKNGKSYDTSMGLTPLQGLVMASRSGDIDPTVLLYFQKELKLSADEIETILNKKSGLLALSEKSSDFRDLEDAVAAGDAKAKLAIDAFIHRAAFYIGGYAGILGRVDAIIFTAGVGENGIDVRASIINKLNALGVKIDPELNNVRGKARVISTSDSAIKVVLMPTNEELVIARDTQNLVK